MLPFEFLKKSLGIVFPLYFVKGFSKKFFSSYVPLTDQILSADCPYVLRYWAICTQYCEILNFEINIMFLIKPFFYMTKKPTQKSKYLENEKSF